MLVGAGACGSASAPGDAPLAPATRPASQTAPPPAASPGDLRAHRIVARAERRQLAHFALLRTRPEGLPARTRQLLGAPIVGMNWRLAQRIPVALPGAYWLVPGNRHLCLVEQGSMGSPGAGATCARTAQAVEHGIADIVIRRGASEMGVAPARLIVGVAPDGARTVRIHTRGSVATVPVVAATFVHRDAIAAPPDFLAPE